jgi:hypothetical protein
MIMNINIIINININININMDMDMCTYAAGLQQFYNAALIEMLGEFFLIYDEGRRCKVIYDENIFPHI